ncbi:MAG: histidine--tRNA ligase [Candidatus Falkowbacteria bacterium]
MAKNIISNQAPKGMADWLPAEFAVRNYIFTTWEKVCRAYNFERYLTSTLENADVYRAKSGEDIGGKELMVFVDQAGRELALRPEMTPSVTRLVSRVYDALPKPVKFFSIANFFRNERPQRGRNREFWQLNCDIFGSDNIASDIEILTLALDLVLAFNPPRDSFVMNLNSRHLIDGLLDSLKLKSEQKIPVVRLLDKYTKLSADNFLGALQELSLNNNQIDEIVKFLSSRNLNELVERLPEFSKNNGYLELKNIFDELEALGYGDYIEFNASVIRGFDYYDGMVFEVFDKHPDNNRAMFGGGRYNGLSDIFGVKNFPAVGMAPGDESTRLFLESWGLIEKLDLNKNDKLLFLPLLDKTLSLATKKLARTLRGAGYQVEMSFEVIKMGKALEYANKKGIGSVVIFGGDEATKKVYKIKDMQTGTEKEVKIKI